MQHQQLDSPPTFLPINESETIKPPKCESGESPPLADDGRSVETYRNSEGPHRHGVLDMGFEESKPQELPGVEVDVITAEDCDLKDLMITMTRNAKEEILTANREIMSDIRALGGNQQRYTRERSRAVKAIVSEVDSPPRVTAATKQ